MRLALRTSMIALLIAALTCTAWLRPAWAGRNVNAGTITCASTATLILAASNGRASLDLKVVGSTTAFIGNSGVTAAAGYQLAQNEVWVSTVPFRGAIYCITSSGTSDLRYLETSD